MLKNQQGTCHTSSNLIKPRYYCKPLLILWFIYILAFKSLFRYKSSMVDVLS